MVRTRKGSKQRNRLIKMIRTNPFNVDAALLPNQDIAQLGAHGGASIKAFCEITDPALEPDHREVCVLKARKGFGKSHVLAVRSLTHRASSAVTLTQKTWARSSKVARSSRFRSLLPPNRSSGRFSF